MSERRWLVEDEDGAPLPEFAQKAVELANESESVRTALLHALDAVDLDQYMQVLHTLEEVHQELEEARSEP